MELAILIMHSTPYVANYSMYESVCEEPGTREKRLYMVASAGNLQDVVQADASMRITY